MSPWWLPALLTDVNRCSLMVAGVDPHEPIWTTGHRRSLGGVDIGIGTSALRQTYTDFTILTILWAVDFTIFFENQYDVLVIPDPLSTRPCDLGWALALGPIVPKEEFRVRSRPSQHTSLWFRVGPGPWAQSFPRKSLGFVPDPLSRRPCDLGWALALGPIVPKEEFRECSRPSQHTSLWFRVGPGPGPSRSQGRV